MAKSRSKPRKSRSNPRKSRSKPRKSRSKPCKSRSNACKSRSKHVLYRASGMQNMGTDQERKELLNDNEFWKQLKTKSMDTDQKRKELLKDNAFWKEFTNTHKITLKEQFSNFVDDMNEKLESLKDVGFLNYIIRNDIKRDIDRLKTLFDKLIEGKRPEEIVNASSFMHDLVDIYKDKGLPDVYKIRKIIDRVDVAGGDVGHILDNIKKLEKEAKQLQETKENEKTNRIVISVLLIIVVLLAFITQAPFLLATGSIFIAIIHKMMP